MKTKGLVFVNLLLISVCLSGCGSNKPNYQVSKEKYEQITDPNFYVSNMDILNLRGAYFVQSNKGIHTYVTEYDNGKVHSADSEYGDVYLDFKRGSYNQENQTWNYDGYYQEEGVWQKVSRVDTLPDDMVFPSFGWFIKYDELKYNSKDRCYELIEESKTVNTYEVYSNIKIKFMDGKVASFAYNFHTTYSDSDPNDIKEELYTFTGYGTTKVTLPVVE